MRGVQEIVLSDDLRQKPPCGHELIASWQSICNEAMPLTAKTTLQANAADDKVAMRESQRWRRINAAPTDDLGLEPPLYRAEVRHRQYSEAGGRGSGPHPLDLSSAPPRRERGFRWARNSPRGEEKGGGGGAGPAGAGRVLRRCGAPPGARWMAAGRL